MICEWCAILGAVDSINAAINGSGPNAPTEELGLKLFEAWEANCRVLHTILKTGCCTCGQAVKRKARFPAILHADVKSNRINSPVALWRRRMTSLKFRQ